LKSIKVADPYIVELVAHEPQIQDPVYFDWDADGSLWVVEMRDYPTGVDGGGVIKRLRDTDNDGFFESAEVFLNNLNFPSGLMPWRKGLLISAAPNLLYAEDTNGDGRADKLETLFSGFTEGNQQHRFNGFQLGLDNWIHGANGDSGGNIVSHRTGHRFQLGGRDFRFNPDTGDFDLTSGQTQFTRRRDDWGNWFGGANYSWGWHYKFPEHYLRRNPRLPVRSTLQPYARYPDAGRLFPISRLQQRFNDIGMAGHVTSAASFTPYRDNLFTGDFQSSLFISDPTHNLVHREVLRPDGITFRSDRAESESQSEFLASTDPWFRPTLVQTGPDGAVYIADMYRLVIEHPEWIPTDTLSQMNVRSGSDMGRIYRVRPRNAPLRHVPHLSTATPEELVDALQSSNGWTRDTAHRLLIEQRPSEIEASLEPIARHHPQPKTRLQALCILDGLDKTQIPLLIHAMADEHPMVRSHAVRLCEIFLTTAGSGSLDTHLSSALAQRIDDPDLRVRFQLAFSLGHWSDPMAASLLARIALKDMAHSDMMIAVLSSATAHAPAILAAVLEGLSDDQPASLLVGQLLVNTLDETSSASIQPILEKLVPQNPDAPMPAWKLNAAASLVQAAERQNDPSNPLPFNAGLSRLFQRARHILSHPHSSIEEQISAIGLLGREPARQSKDATYLASFIHSANPLEVQLAALARMAQLSQPTLGKVLVEAWSETGPKVRTSLLNTLLQRAPWTLELLEAMDDGRIVPNEVGASGRQALLTHSNPSIRNKAIALFNPPDSARPRESLVKDQLQQMAGLVGNPESGRGLFEVHCAACHKTGNAGHGAGPNLAMLHDQDLETILIAILDPNRAIEEKYRSYTATTRSGNVVSGIILNESGNSITLMDLSGNEHTLLRADLESLTSNPASLMPEGFETFLGPPDLAHLIAFIRASAIPPKVVPGNTPALVLPNSEGAIHLTAARAEIFGDTLIFESQYKNLGYWSSLNDRAGWTLEIEKPTQYDVWLDWACSSRNAGSHFILQIADAKIEGRIESTGTWDDYRQSRIGKVILPPGRHRVTLRAGEEFNGFLADIRTIQLLPTK
jgi:putative membrane-bound dehydrogenase-like protein